YRAAREDASVTGKGTVGDHGPRRRGEGGSSRLPAPFPRSRLPWTQEGDFFVSIDRDPDLVMPVHARPTRWSGRRLPRGIISVWLAFHLAAIIIAPAAVAPSSGLIREAWGLFQPYLEV